jgi:hypothetical protein
MINPGLSAGEASSQVAYDLNDPHVRDELGLSAAVWLGFAVALLEWQSNREP